MFSWFSLQSGIRGGGYLSQIDALRGWAILLVFFFHAWGISGGSTGAEPSLWFSYVAAGRTGVTLFFVISGFLLSIPWLRAMQSPDVAMPSLKNYYAARVLRIVPLYYLAVFMACVVSGSWGTGFKAFTFQFVGFEIFPFSVVWWTLVTEVQFYLVLPLLIWLLASGGKSRLILLLVLILWGGVYMTQALHNPSGEKISSYLLTKSLLGRLPAFLLGMLAAWIFLKTRALPIFSANWVRVLGAVAVLLALYVNGVVLRHTVLLGEWQSESNWHEHHIYEAILWSVVLLVLVLTRPLFYRIIANSVLAVVGKLSYSLYLWHVPILFHVIYPTKERIGVGFSESVLAYLLTFAALLLSLMASLLTYRFIELPGLNVKRRLPI
ncbi:acyltransferase [Luminiphilus sp.]|nr:acyltransferase [Luminiphilus sp.]